MKRILLTTFILILPALAFGQLRVGIMNPDEVLDALPETAQVEADLQQYVQERQAAYQERYQSWISELTAFSERVDAGELSEEAQQQEQQRLTEQQEELSNMQARIQRQIQQRQNELINPLLTRVENAMNEVAEELGLEFVINKNASTGDPIIYYSSQRGVDITERVIQLITQN
ncbi:MAG: OmpH family outer membrane protein [Balneolaceae bacterium]|nr:OmpH family outer membrane protein [Balneolaceae bacterium]